MKLCTVQPHMSDSISDNVIEITRWIKRAAGEGADVVLFPEMMLSGYDHHLHDLFKDTRWHRQVDEALSELSDLVDASETSAFVGMPYPYGGGHLNALVLLQPESDAVLAGARSHLPVGDRNRWGFVEPEDRVPTDFHGISFGSIFCAEAHHLDYTQRKGLEKSDVILWPGVVGSDHNEKSEVTTDWNVELARKIAIFYNVPVLQSNYLTYATDISTQSMLESNRKLGGSIACDASGQVLDQASRTDEEIRWFELSRVNGTVKVTALETTHQAECSGEARSIE